MNLMDLPIVCINTQREAPVYQYTEPHGRKQKLTNFVGPSSKQVQKQKELKRVKP